MSDHELWTEGDTGNGNTHAISYLKIADVKPSSFCQMTFNGSGGYNPRESKSFIIPHPREYPAFYKKRVENGYFPSYFKPIIRATYNPVFAEQIERNYPNNTNEFWTGNDESKGFVNDCTNGGQTLDTFEKHIIKDSQIEGITAVIMDNFPAQEIPQADAEALSQRKFPYVYERHAEQIAFEYTKTDKFGNLEEITFIEGYDQNDKPVYKTWTKLGWYEFTLEGEKKTVLSSGEYDLNGQIPVYLVISGDKESPRQLDVLPPYYQVAVANNIMFQVVSETRDLSKSTKFPILYIQGMSDVDSVTLNSKSILAISGDENIQPPAYVQPDVKLFEDGRNEVEAIKDQIYQLAEQNGVRGNTVQSGLSKAYDWQAQESLLKEVSNRAQDLDNWIQWMFGVYTTTVEGGSNFPKDFQPDSNEAIVSEAEAYGMLEGATKASKIGIALQAFDSLTAGNDEPWVNDVRENYEEQIEQALIDGEKDEPLEGTTLENE
jgi:hypothetical protein